MFLLGLLLLAATGAFTGLVIADNLSGGPEYTVSILGENIATINTLAVFCAGFGSGAHLLPGSGNDDESGGTPPQAPSSARGARHGRFATG